MTLVLARPLNLCVEMTLARPLNLCVEMTLVLARPLDAAHVLSTKMFEILEYTEILNINHCWTNPVQRVLNNWSGETSPYLRVLQVLCYYINLEKVTHTQKILLTSSLSLRITTYTTLDCGSFKIQGCFLKLRRKRCVSLDD